MNHKILEGLQIVSGFAPVNMASGANTGDYVSMKGYRRLVVLLFKGIGAAGQDPTITIQQATNVSGGSVKALNFTTVYVKQDFTTLADVGQWTKVTQASGNTYTNDTLAESQALVAIEFKAEDLDIANDFDCVIASVADVGSTSQIGGLLYLLGDPVENLAPESMASAIVN